MPSEAVSLQLELTDPGPSPISQGLEILKTIWPYKARLEELVKKSAGRALSVAEIFGTLLGSDPNPIAAIEKELQEINKKLDMVLEGIRQIQLGLLGLGVLAVYIDIGDSVFLIEKYTEELRDHLGTDAASEEARRTFVEKLKGTRNERDGVQFCAQKIVKLGPNQSPLLFDLLFPYIASDVKPENAAEVYAKGAFAFRFIVDLLLKALVLELFVASTAPKDTVVGKVEKVVKKYRDWFRAMIDNSFLPFAERMAAYRFQAEYFGGNSVSADYNKPFPKWTAPKDSILRSADDLVRKVMGRSTGATLRVVPFVPPITKGKIPSAYTGGGVQAGSDFWEHKHSDGGPSKEVAWNTIWDHRMEVFGFYGADGKVALPSHASRGEAPLPKVNTVPEPLRGTSLPFIRMEYGWDSGAAQTVRLGVPKPALVEALKPFNSTWDRFYEESGHRFPPTSHDFRHFVLEIYDPKAMGVFHVPGGGHLSPVLFTYSYDKFGDEVKAG